MSHMLMISHITKPFAPFIVVVALCCDGCGDGLPSDPVTDFRQFVDRFHAKFQPSIAPAQAWQEGPGRRALLIGKPKRMDVRKTDSLVSPMVGVIVMRAVQVDDQSRNADLRYDSVALTISFGYQEGRWVPTSAILGAYSDEEGLRHANLEVMSSASVACQPIRERLKAAAAAANAK